MEPGRDQKPVKGATVGRVIGLFRPYWKSAILVAISVTAASSGVKTAQATVLHSLYGVGTDVTVTQSPARGSGDRKSTRLNSSHSGESRMPSSA